MYEFLWQSNKDYLDNCALNYFGKRITYRKLFSMIDETARAFSAIGVNEKDIVPIVTVSTVQSIICFYALNKIGAVADYINVLSEEDELKRLFEEADSNVIVTLDLFANKVINAANKIGKKTVITFGVELDMPILLKLGYKAKMRGKHHKIDATENIIPWKEFIKKSKGENEREYRKNPNEMCLLAHTGGTTGVPKAVMLNDKAVNAVVAQYIDVSGIERGEVFLNLMIPFVLYGIVTNVHLPLCLGLESVVIPKFDAKEWKNYFKKYKPNHILAVPSYIIPFLNDKNLEKMDISYFKSAGVGGDGMTAELEVELNSFFKAHNSNAVVLKGFGMTEVCATAIVGFAYSNRIGSVGIPFPKVNMMIYDREKESELTYKEIGEICIQSPSQMLGYLNNKKATEDLIWTHSDGSKWIHTGDLGYIDEDGFLFIVGRMKRMILTTKGGIAYKVFPNMAEEILESHTSVVQSCIVGANDGDDQVLRAHIMVSKEDISKNVEIEKELRKICEGKLPSYSRPTFYCFSDSLPLTAAGKVDYRELEKRDVN